MNSKDLGLVFYHNELKYCTQIAVKKPRKGEIFLMVKLVGRTNNVKILGHYSKKFQKYFGAETAIYRQPREV